MLTHPLLPALSSLQALLPSSAREIFKYTFDHATPYLKSIPGSSLPSANIQASQLALKDPAGSILLSPHQLHVSLSSCNCPCLQMTTFQPLQMLAIPWKSPSRSSSRSPPPWSPAWAPRRSDHSIRAFVLQCMLYRILSENSNTLIRGAVAQLHSHCSLCEKRLPICAVHSVYCCTWRFWC